MKTKKRAWDAPILAVMLAIASFLLTGCGLFGSAF